MRNFFSRLYSYRERADVAPLENFLTEAFADLFNRVPREQKISLVAKLLPVTQSVALAARLANTKKLEIVTQVSAVLAGSTTRPDMALYADGSLVLAIEAKVSASIQQHRLAAAADETEINLTRSQLETYVAWVAEQRASEWPGAVVFLTGGTDPPDDFLQRSDYGVIRAVRGWRDIGDWIFDEISTHDRELAYTFLALELFHFLKEHKLMSKYISSKDLAATMLFLPSSKALHLTFFEVIKSVSKHAPKLRGGRQMKAEFWADANSYYGWFFFAKSVKRPKSKPYIAVGICFLTDELFSDDVANLPLHEPFFFTFCADDWNAEIASVFLTSIPEGWTEIGQDQWIIATRALREFSADPDIRVEELKIWAIQQVDSLTRCIPGYEDAAFEKAPPEEDEDSEG